MSNITGNQYLYNGPGYLDAKIQPVENVSDLNKILLRQRFIGLTVTVIHPDGPDSKPCDYWLVQDPNEEQGVLMWEKKGGTGEHTVVDTQTPDYITVTKDGNTYYVDAAGNFVGEIDEIKDAISSIMTAITEVNEHIDSEVERLDERIDTEISAVTDVIESQVSALTEVINTEVETINDRIDTEVSSLTETITTETERLDTRIDTEVSALTETITTEVERIDNTISSLTETVTTEIERIDAKDDEQDERLDEISQWHVEKLSDDSGVTKYGLVDGSGNTIGDVIEIIDEQYLETVEYISAATEEDKEIDERVIIGDPYLKFTWKYGIITYVAVKDWINDYFEGPGIAISQSHEISVKLVEPEEGNQNYLSVDSDGLKMNILIEIDE